MEVQPSFLNLQSEISYILNCTWMFLLTAILAFFTWINFRYGKIPISLCGLVVQVSEYLFLHIQYASNGEERNYCLTTMLE